MLGSRTKQVFSYGKRRQRIVNVSDDHCRRKETPSIFDDVEPTQWAPVASRMKKRENTIPIKPRTPSPKIIRMNRKKRLSPVQPVAKKWPHLAHIVDAEAPKQESPPALKPMTKAMRPKTSMDARTPFSHFPLNAPGSPAVLPGRSPPTKGNPLRRHRPFLPFVDMDIIILDEDGKPAKQERRISRTGVDVNPFNQQNTNESKGHIRQLKPSQPPADSTDSEADFIEQLKKPKRSARRARAVYSDDSESDDEVLAPEPEATKNAAPSLGRGVRTEAPRVVDVAVLPPHSVQFTKTSVQTTPPQPVSPEPLPPPPNSYQPISSPPLRPRRLTPIRGSRSRYLFEPPSPPSPACTDFDLSLELEELTLASSSHNNTSHHAEPNYPSHLQPLLEECHQESCGPIEFSSFIDTFPFDPVVQREDGEPVSATFRKIGEASYSEVFGIGDVVLKVIPLRDESTSDASIGKLKMNVNSGEVEDGPAPSDAKDVRKEIIVTRAMGEVCDGFVKLLKTYIVRGKYPEVLLRLWDEYHETKGSESVRPGMYTSRFASKSQILNAISYCDVRYLSRFAGVRHHCVTQRRARSGSIQICKRQQNGVETSMQLVLASC